MAKPSAPAIRPSPPPAALVKILERHARWLATGGKEGRRADLRWFKELSETDLIGADLEKAQLPPDFEFKALEVAQATAAGAHKVFLFLLVICVFCLITIWTTKDLALLFGTHLSKLPFVDVPVPIVYFYWAGPPLLVLGAIYFHIYLLDLWRAMARLPAVFADGLSLAQATSPLMKSKSQEV